MQTLKTDERGRVWMLVSNPLPHPRKNDHARGLRRDRHVSVEELLDDTMSLPGIMGRLMSDIRMRTAQSLLQRSCSGKAFIMRSSQGVYSLQFVSDHPDDDHELAKCLAREIDKIISEDDDWLRLYQVI
jgi:hypothetical protein